MLVGEVYIGYYQGCSFDILWGVKIESVHNFVFKNTCHAIILSYM